MWTPSSLHANAGDSWWRPAFAQARRRGAAPHETAARLRAWLCGFVLVTSLLAFVGWTLGLEAPKTWLAGHTTMKANTAFGLSGVAISLWPTARCRGARLACALAAAALAAATLAEYLFGVSLGIDELLFADPRTTSAPFRGRPSPATALALVGLGCGAALLAGAKPRIAMAQWLAVPAAAIGCLSLVGYAYGVERLYKFGPYVSVAVNTALALCALAACVLWYRPEESWGRALIRRPAARAVFTRLLPASLALPFLFGLVVLAGVRIGWYEPLFGIALFAVLSIGGFVLLSWATVIVAARVEGSLQQTNAELIDAKLRAEAATRAKSRFLAGMSHELRTPLHGILGYAELLRQAGGLDEAQGQRVHAMLRTGRHLLNLIDGVLTLSEIEDGQVWLKPAEFDPRELAWDCALQVRPEADARGLSIGVNTTAEVPRRIMADPTRFRQILLNLLGNAVKFTDQGTIDVRLRVARRPGDAAVAKPDDEFLLLEVVDTGRGVLSAQRNRLFREFQRLDAAGFGSAEGAGLGLAIAFRLATAMGGHLAHADNPGGGSIFTVQLPLSAGTVSLPAPIPAESFIAAAGPAAAAEKLRVLVVDDTDMNLDITSGFLRAGGHEVTCAAGGSEGVALAAREEFDVVLMDLRMPQMDGFEATRRIRALPGGRGRVPVVAVTAHAFAEQIDACQRVGMAGHLAKPFTPAALQATLEAAVYGHSRPNSPEPPQDRGASLPTIDEHAYDLSAACLAPGALISYLERIVIAGEGALQKLGFITAASTVSPEFVDTAHRLAGMVGMLGYARLAQAARRFEQSARDDQPDFTACKTEFIAALKGALLETRRRLSTMEAVH